MDTPQISNAPDPISMMQNVPSDLGSNLTAGWVKSIDDYINGLIHRAGDIVGAGVTKMAEGAMAVGGAVTSMTSSAVAPFKPDFSPSASYQGPEAPSPSHGLGREPAIEPEGPSLAQLGELSPPPTPSMGVRQSQGMGLA